MSEFIDETSLTDEEVAAAIAEAKAKKAQKEKARAEEKPKLEKTKNLDEESSDDLLNESSTAAQIEAEEDESPAVRSAKSFSNAFAAAKKKREQDLLRKKEERKPEPEPEPEPEEESESDEEEAKDDAPAAAAVIDSDDDDDAEFETDSEEDEADESDDDESDEEEPEDEDPDDDDDEEYDEDDEDESENYDGIFETDDENGEYNTTVSVGDEEEDDDEDDEDEDDDDESAFSTKTKVIIGVVIAVLVIAIIAAIAFFMKGTGEKKPTDTSSVASVSNGDVTSVKFAEPSVSLKVGETVALKLIVEPENATDKTFKLKSNDETIVKVNEQGQITGIASGSTTVTATLKSNPTMTASLVVNVIDEEQSTLNTYNKFINSILDGSTDIDPDSETDTDTEENEENEDAEEAESDTESDTDTEKAPKKPKRVLSGNKIDDFDSDGELELALYYEPSTESEEPLVRVFYMAAEGEEEEQQDTEEEEVQLYDEYGNPIESSDTESDTESEKEKKESDSDKGAAKEKVLTEMEQYSDRYGTIYSALQADSATTPWNTSYLEVKEGEQATARVRILSKGYTAPTYTYESEDEEIATVDKQGNIKGIKPGTVFITVSSPLNSDAVAKIKVRVKDDTDLLDDYLKDIPVVNNTNDSVFPTETLTGKAIVDIDNDGVSELLLRFRYSDNVETINMIKIENEKCVCYKTYNNLSDLYEYNEGSGSYSNSILIHYTTGRVCMEYKAIVAKEGSKSKTSEEKILTIESGGSLSEMVNFRTATEISTKTVTSEVTVDDRTTSSRYEEDEDTDSETYYEDTDSEEESTESDTASYIDEDEDGYDDITGEYFGSYAKFDFEDIEEAANNGGIDLTNKLPVKKLPEPAGAPDDEDDDYYEDYDNDYDENDDDEPTTSTVTTEVTEETTKYFVNGTLVEQGVYEETLTRYSATYSVWNAWESVY